MNAVRFISGKIRFKGYLTIVCVAVSYLVMIIAVTVSSGFRNEIRASLSENYGDVRLTPINEDLASAAVSVLKAFTKHFTTVLNVKLIIPQTAAVQRFSVKNAAPAII